MDRQTKGFLLWGWAAFIFGIIVIIPMIAREVYLYFKYLKPCKMSFEWEDITSYGMLIMIFSLFHWCVTDLCGLPCWTMW